MSYDLDEQVPELEALIREFYDALFVDVLVGFLFQPHDKEALIASQIRWLRAHLGDRKGTWGGGSIRAIHANLPILAGQFDRRHHVLEELLGKWEVPREVRDEWLLLDKSLRPLVLNLGAVSRDRFLEEE